MIGFVFYDNLQDNNTTIVSSPTLSTNVVYFVYKCDWISV